MTTTARRVLSCNRCGFKMDALRHMQSCVPTRYWPAEMRDRKATAMGQLRPQATCCERPLSEHPYFTDGAWHFATIAQRMPSFDRVKPRSLYEYRQLHPEANPLVAENETLRERRKNVTGVEVDMERLATLAEVRGRAVPTCPRCTRPLLVPSAHLDCKPPQSRVMTGPGWYDRAPSPEPDAPLDDDPELADFLDPGRAQREALIAEQEHGHDLRALDDMTPDEASEAYTLQVPEPQSLLERMQDADPGAYSAAASEFGDRPPLTVEEFDRLLDAEVPALAEPAKVMHFPCIDCERVLQTKAALASHRKTHLREA